MQERNELFIVLCFRFVLGSFAFIFTRWRYGNLDPCSLLKLFLFDCNKEKDTSCAVNEIND